ncbi:MAG: hypothetical protein MUF08_01385, partial [Burkholderiaceae bacterium]|nr:hypothetical protein [Burkholderiaceae bacterium]
MPASCPSRKAGRGRQRESGDRTLTTETAALKTSATQARRPRDLAPGNPDYRPAASRNRRCVWTVAQPFGCTPKAQASSVKLAKASTVLLMMMRV